MIYVIDVHLHIPLLLIISFHWSGHVICKFLNSVCSCYIFSLKLFDCAQVALLFLGNELEWPMFCRNVDSFPFRQISGSRFVHFLAKVMPWISAWLVLQTRTYQVPGICRTGKESTFLQSIGLFMSLFILLGLELIY